MRPVILASVFLVVNCVCGALSVEIIREQQSKDLLKLTSTRKRGQISKRRFRRDENKDKEDHPDIYNADKEQGDCKVPTLSGDRGLDKFDWKFENETKLSISMSWIGKRATGESSAMLLLATTEFMFLFSKPSELYKSDDFGKTFKRINAEVFNTHIRKDSGIMKSPVNPKKVILVSHSIPFFPSTSGIVLTEDGGESWRKIQSYLVF